VRNAPANEERLKVIDMMLREAASQRVSIVCFPEAYLPGLRGMDFPVAPPDQRRQEAALRHVRAVAARNRVAVIIGMEWEGPRGLLNVAFVIDRDGQVLGYQAKNQIAPSEDPYYVPGDSRRLFEIDGVPFGIAICHEGWRYPESVRWSVRRGAKVIFHPHMTGSDEEGIVPKRWGDPDAPYYEKAMILRAVENDVWFASVNCATRFQESATSLVDPDGRCVAHVPYGEERLLVCDVDLSRATGRHALQFNPDVYGDGGESLNELVPTGRLIPTPD
jgi:predicted amidohydrolase